MNKLISTIAVAVLMSGCAPMIGLTQPIFPAVPPEKPKSEPESPKSRATATQTRRCWQACR